MKRIEMKVIESYLP